MSCTFGLIPAAGKSRRMGRPKLALPLGGRTVLEAVVAAVAQAGVERVVVVVGPEAGELPALAQGAGASVVQLTADTAEMRDTIECGLAWLEEHCRPADTDGWLLLPADHPCIDAEVVRHILAAHDRDADKSIVIPTFAGRRGHPTWISWQHIAALRALPRGVGLNALLRQLGRETLELEVASAAVLWDLDTPEDYERLRAQALISPPRPAS